jgi:hypothetical protein
MVYSDDFLFIACNKFEDLEGKEVCLGSGDAAGELEPLACIWRS